MQEKYNFTEIEKKWQKRWEEAKLFKTVDDSEKEKYYLLEMFPYPSGKLHMGHVRNYSIGDVASRFLNMKGYNVLHPMGWDAFGLPAENAAIQRDIHPDKWTAGNMAEMKEQLGELGFAYDWEREIATCDPDYYKWTQWIFIQFFKNKLAYKKKNPVNWCPSCETVLANEQVVDGACERCGTPVGKKNLEQWYLKITDYADRLLKDLDTLDDWPNKVKTMQTNWIGKSVGAEVDFSIVDYEKKMRIFTTRPDTLYGVTYMVLAPEHPYVDTLVKGTEYEEKVDEFLEKLQYLSDIDRTSTVLEKEGLFIGRYAINPLNGKKIPIYIANYVLMDYGTGAIMAVPAHDQRDFDFAKKYDLDIIPVIEPESSDIDINDLKEAFIAKGKLINSDKFNGMDNEDAIVKIIDFLEKEKIGEESINFRLRDWLISRQRYWGTPIPMIKCPKCGWVPEKEENLPVVLPKDVEFSGKGESPLTTSKSFRQTTCPQCGGDAEREIDTMDTFLDSSWYFLRFTDPKNSSEIACKDRSKYWMPVDQYIGGVEHAILHLLYARFFTKFLYDIGWSPVSEPFSKLLTQGMVLKDGKRMSKSKGNVVAPREIIDKYGADTARLFTLFASPPEKELEWSDVGVEGSYRFLNRVYKMVQELSIELKDSPHEFKAENDEDKELLFVVNTTIKKVGDDIKERFNFNTAISSIMEMVNAMAVYRKKESINKGLLFDTVKKLVLLLSPFVPHICEEMWEELGNTGYIYNESWPKYDEDAMVKEMVEIVVQLNGKVKEKIDIANGITKDEMINVVQEDEKIKKLLCDKKIIKKIAVPGKLVNFVVK